jgi:hypothetical protein
VELYKDSIELANNAQSSKDKPAGVSSNTTSSRQTISPYALNETYNQVNTRLNYTNHVGFVAGTLHHFYAVWWTL